MQIFLLVCKIIRLIYLTNFSLHLKEKPDSYLKGIFNIVIYLTFHLTLISNKYIRFNFKRLLYKTIYLLRVHNV